MRAAQVEKPSVADQQENENSPNQVVNVAAVDHHVLKGTHVPLNQVHEDADAGKRDEERNRGNEHAAPRPVGYGGTNDESQPRQLQQNQQHRHDKGGKCQQQQSSCADHLPIESPKLIAR